MRFGEVRNYIDPFHATRAVARCARPPQTAALVVALRDAEGVASYLRAHAAEIGSGPSPCTMELEQQYMC